MTYARRVSPLLLAYLAACGARYDIGEVPDSGAGGTTTGVGTGGTSAPMSTGGSSANAVGGSDPVAGSTATGGAVATGGTDAGDAGTSGSPFPGATDPSRSPSRTENPTCATGYDVPPRSFTYGTLATPEVLAQRISTFAGDSGAPLTPPSETTPEAAVSMIDAVLAYDAAHGSLPFVLSNFAFDWLGLDNNSDANRAVAIPAAMFFLTPGSTLADLVGASAWRNPTLNQIRTTIPDRGMFMLESLFCTSILPALAMTAPPADSNLTERQRLEAAEAGNPACSGCHSLIDPLGDSLANIDANGNYGSRDANGNPIDASGVFTNQSGFFFRQKTFTFTSIDDLAPQFLDSCDVIRCFVVAFTMVLPQHGALQPDELDYVVAEFSQNGLRLDSLVHALVQTPTFLQQ